MMPIIRPLVIPSTPLTEYQKEKEIVAKLKVEFCLRNRVMRRLSARFVRSADVFRKHERL